MPFDSTGFDQPPPRPEPSHGRRRGRRFVLFAALWGAVLAGGPVALMAWEGTHESVNDAACDTPQRRPAATAPDVLDVQRANAPAHANAPAYATRCDAGTRRAVTR